MSRCKACNTRIEPEGELCSACGEVSSYYVGEAQALNDMALEGKESGPVATYFMQYLLDRPELTQSWADGVGLMAPEERWDMLYEKAFVVFEQAVYDGFPLDKACKMATRRDMRGNLRYSTPGTAQVADGQSVGDVNVEQQLAGGSLSWDNLW